ncbi:MAG: hypothetical protein LBG82_06930 [Clostridiales Family XIII bacterium]|nr:hypothetical protein [Clostridiales Family XIII bacterium]
MENNSTLSFEERWRLKSSKIGMIMIGFIIVLMFGPIIYLKLAYGVFPTWDVALTAWGTIAAAFGVYYFVEPLSYYPILGITGTYMAFTAGSISDIRMPASSVAQETTGVKFGSPEGSVISTIGVAGSLITTLSVVFITAIAGTSIVGFLPDSILVALKSYTIPAVFGATYVLFCKFSPKLSFIIIVSTVLYLLISGVNYGLYMIVCVVVSVIIARALYKKGILGDNSSGGKRDESSEG